MRSRLTVARASAGGVRKGEPARRQGRRLGKHGEGTRQGVYLVVLGAVREIANFFDECVIPGGPDQSEIACLGLGGDRHGTDLLCAGFRAAQDAPASELAREIKNL
jgi:hypothetical protein